jgi:hypothetical protein
MSYRIRRVDANQQAIVEEFRGYGATVFIVSMLGNGFPDIVVGYRGKNYLFELKDGDKPPSQQKLTAPEKAFFQKWGGQVSVIKSLEEVRQFMEVLYGTSNPNKTNQSLEKE